MAEVTRVKIADLKTNLFVREALDEDRVLFFAGIVESGSSLDPIVVNRDLVVVDGRHRIEAHELNEKTEIEVKIVDIVGEENLIAAAYRANTGGPLPPTTNDTEHTILSLIEMGVRDKRIIEILGLPPALTRKYISSVRSKIGRQKLMKAATAVTDGGLTVAKAAEQYGVEIDKLRDFLAGPRKRRRAEGVAEIRRDLTTRYRSASQSNAALFRVVFRKYDEGDVTEKQIRQILKQLKGLQKRAINATTKWEARLEAKVNPGKANGSQPAPEDETK